MCGIRSIDRIVDLCQRDIGFMWLAQGLKPKRDAFYNFINNKVSKEILDDLHYQRFLNNKGHKKTEIQKLYEDFSRYGLRLIKYKDNFEIIIVIQKQIKM